MARISHRPDWFEQPHQWRGTPLLIAVAIALVLVAMLGASFLGSLVSPGMFR